MTPGRGRRAAPRTRSEGPRGPSRRLVLAGGLAFAGGVLPGCASLRVPGIGGGSGGGQAALLLPLTGEQAALGQAMSRSASLVGPGPETGPEGGALPVFDTEGSSEGARRAARAALDGGARMLLGPLRADQTPAALEEAGEVPVVSFSNDDRLAAQGAFVMGLTPAQSVATVFSFARAQGARRVALVARPGPLGEASVRAARELAAAGGLTLTATLLREGASGLAGALRSAGGGVMPEAVMLPDGGAPMLAFAEALAGAGPRLMGGVQWGVQDLGGIPALEGAWFAAPSPNAFLPFLDRFETRFGQPAGVVTALAHDAAIMAAELRAARALNRKGLTRTEGFAGALGRYRFLEDGRCQRDLAVLTIEGGRIVTIGEVTGT